MYLVNCVKKIMIIKSTKEDIYMQKLNKNDNNKGFSLVELLVTISVMVVLVGCLGAVLLGYVDKAKIAKDVQAADDMARNVKYYVLYNGETRQREINGSSSLSLIWNKSTDTDSFDDSDVLESACKQLGGNLPISSYNENCPFGILLSYEDSIATNEQQLVLEIYMGPSENSDDMMSNGSFDEQYMLYPDLGSYWNR